MATDCPDHKDIFIHLLGDSARKKQVPPSVLESTPGYICGAANLASCFPSKGGLSFHNKEHDISVPRVEKKAGASAELSEEVTAAPLGRNLSARNSGIGQDSNKNLVFKEGMAGPQCCSVLVTGANRGIGLELVSQLLRKTNPPKVVFATCRDPEGAKGQVSCGSCLINLEGKKCSRAKRSPLALLGSWLPASSIFPSTAVNCFQPYKGLLRRRLRI